MNKYLKIIGILFAGFCIFLFLCRAIRRLNFYFWIMRWQFLTFCSNLGGILTIGLVLLLIYWYVNKKR